MELALSLRSLCCVLRPSAVLAVTPGPRAVSRLVLASAVRSTDPQTALRLVVLPGLLHGALVVSINLHCLLCSRRWLGKITSIHSEALSFYRRHACRPLAQSEVHSRSAGRRSSVRPRLSVLQRPTRAAQRENALWGRCPRGFGFLDLARYCQT